nr:MAG TPA: hypothetical protein [Caudoviricetes sp.]
MKTLKESLSHSFNGLRIIINSYRRQDETNEDLIERAIDTNSIMRELMNAVNPCMGRSHLESVLRSDRFMNSL